MCIRDRLNTVLNQNDDDVFIALETMAGKGSEIGRSFEAVSYTHLDVYKRQILDLWRGCWHRTKNGFERHVVYSYM